MTDSEPTRIQDCCANQDNLEERPSDRTDVTLRVCRECGRRHLEMSVDPAAIGVRPT